MVNKLTKLITKWSVVPHANLGRNIVGKQLPTLLYVTCCVRLLTLLHVVAQTLKWVKLLASCKRMQQLPSMLGVVGQQCFVRLHGALDIKLSRLKPREKGRNIFGQQLPALMGLVTSFAHRLTTHENFFTEDFYCFATRVCHSNLGTAENVKLRADGRRNIVSQQLPRLFGVVASVCTWLKVWPVSNLCSTSANNTQQPATRCGNGRKM